MINRVLFLTLLFLTHLFGDDPYKNLDHYTLKNGMQIYLMPDNKSKNIFIKAEVKVGMKAETKENAGISHLVEHIIFRDQRAKGKDFYNLIKEKGATDVNGYTSYYKTEYVTTIKPSEAKWIVKSFYTMLFDKNVTNEDLRVEKGALQLEIGEPTWMDYVLPGSKTLINIGKFFKAIFPPNDDVFESDFQIDPDIEKIDYQDSLTYKLNNKKFTLKEVMDHYHKYYFPANITLKIAGKFDKESIKKLIDKTFAKVPAREGPSIQEPIYKDAKLNNKPYIRYRGGEEESSNVVLGAKFLEDDPKKVLVLKAYTESLADRLLKKFRNQKGEAYGVHGFVNSYRNAGIAQISFNAPHDAFDKNVKTATEWIKKESNGDINESVIKDALQQKRNRYDAIEHDVGSLMQGIDTYIWYHRIYPDAKTPYQYLDEITPNYFRKVLHEVFQPNRKYMLLNRDYVLFPYEGIVLNIFAFFISLFFFVKFITAKVPKRKVRLKRTLTNWFGIVLIAIIMSIFIEFFDEWILFFLSKLYPVKPEFYDIPKAYLFFFILLVIDIVVSYFVIKKLFSWFYMKLYITDKEMILSGPKAKYIPLDQIKSFEVASYSPLLWSKIYGNAFFFWRKLLKVVLKNGKVGYLRSSNATHLKEDLEDILSNS